MRKKLLAAVVVISSSIWASLANHYVIEDYDTTFDANAQLAHAITSRNMSRVQFILSSKGPDVNSNYTDYGHLPCSNTDDNSQKLFPDNPKVAITPLMIAVICDSYEIVQLLLDQGARVNARDSSGNSALMYAVKTDDDSDIAKLLIGRGADLELKNDQGDTPLLMAARLGYAAMTRLLSDYGANIAAANGNGETVLMAAAGSNSSATVANILFKGADPNQRSNNSIHDTPLLVASRLGNADIVQLLLNAKADVNATGKDKLPALLVAASAMDANPANVNKYCQTIRQLVISGSAVNNADPGGMTPLMFTAKHCDVQTVKFLLDFRSKVDAANSDRKSVLSFAASSLNKDLEVIRLLLSRGAAINASDNNGKTAVMEAAQSGNLGLVEFFCEKGADYDAVLPQSNFTALVLAGIKCHIDVVDFLFNKTKSENNKRKAFKESASAGCNDVVKYFLHRGVDVDARDDDDSLNAWLATADDGADRVGTMTLLYKHGANVNATDLFGRTALMYVASWGSTDECQAVIRFGVAVNVLAKDGECALTIAGRRGRFEVVRLLLNNGADRSLCPWCSDMPGPPLTIGGVYG